MVVILSWSNYNRLKISASKAGHWEQKVWISLFNYAPLFHPPQNIENNATATATATATVTATATANTTTTTTIRGDILQQVYRMGQGNRWRHMSEIYIFSPVYTLAGQDMGKQNECYWQPF